MLRKLGLFFFKLILPLLRELGMVPCCDTPDLEEVASTHYYYEYRCRNCAHRFTGGTTRNHL